VARPEKALQNWASSTKIKNVVKKYNLRYFLFFTKIPTQKKGQRYKR
jgi:hypothetical protein